MTAAFKIVLYVGHSNSAISIDWDGEVLDNVSGLPEQRVYSEKKYGTQEAPSFSGKFGNLVGSYEMNTCSVLKVLDQITFLTTRFT